MSADYADLEGRIADAPYTLGLFKIIGTRTGRMSSSQPNLQNMPRSAPAFKVGDPVAIVSGDQVGRCGLIVSAARRHELPVTVSYDVSTNNGVHRCCSSELRRTGILDVLADIGDAEEGS